ncbi:MaoC/PaaZ C-terminal domain-containing protein [Streptomyces sp. NPDC056296]|uniref:MaoC/PaaZ C-terminal domain-containing protein n=1 Tax=Streptomyces sp. NPDC056296 TaxID=3345775 RepID=UPI0035E18162
MNASVDISTMTAAVGTELPPLEVPAISRATLALFAGASGDHNPIHIDTDVARSAGVDDVFAHGMLSMAYLGRLLTGWVPQEHVRSLRVRFLAVTPVHARPVCRAQVTAVEHVANERHLTLAVTVTLPDGTTTLTGDAGVALTAGDPSDTEHRGTEHH